MIFITNVEPMLDRNVRLAMNYAIDKKALVDRLLRGYAVPIDTLQAPQYPAFDPTTKKLTWNGTYSGLTGPATGAHFQGPAEPGKNASIAVTITPATSPFKGSATLTDAQAVQLVAGRWYVNIYTDAYKGGELRGQIVKM